MSDTLVKPFAAVGVRFIVCDSAVGGDDGGSFIKKRILCFDLYVSNTVVHVISYNMSSSYGEESVPGDLFNLWMNRAAAHDNRLVLFLLRGDPISSSVGGCESVWGNLLWFDSKGTGVMGMGNGAMGIDYRGLYPTRRRVVRSLNCYGCWKRCRIFSAEEWWRATVTTTFIAGINIMGTDDCVRVPPLVILPFGARSSFVQK